MGITFTCPNAKSSYVLGKTIVSQVQLQLQFPNMFNLLLVFLNYLLPTITTHYLDATNFFSCHNIMPFGISFTLKAARLGNGNFTTPFFYASQYYAAQARYNWCPMECHPYYTTY